METQTWFDYLSETPYRRLATAACSGFILALCFPPYYLWFLLPVPFVLLYGVMIDRRGWEAFRVGFTFAVVFYLAHTYWFVSFHPLALPFMLIWLGLIYGAWCVGVSHVGWNPFFATAGWVLVQWFLGIGYHAFPWSRLATALAVVPSFIQPVRYLGEFGLGGLIVLFGFTVADALFHKRRQWLPIVLVVIIGVCLGEGYVRYQNKSVSHSEQLVLLVQPNVASGDFREDPHAQLRHLHRLTEQRAREGDLVVWPETAVIREPFRLDGETLKWATARWHRFFDRLLDPGFSLFLGVRFTDPKPGHLPRLNGAVLLDSSADPVHFYTKRRPVPGGEHLPFMGSVPAIEQFGRMVGTLGYRAGEKGGLIPFDTGNRRWTIGTQICFEDAFDQHVRDQVNRGADLLINISNDSWSRSRASHWQHFYRARIRAVESGRMVLRNGNTGVSALVDPVGRLIDVLPPYERGTVEGRLVEPLNPPLFTRWGNWITVFGLLGLVGMGYGWSRWLFFGNPENS